MAIERVALRSRQERCESRSCAVETSGERDAPHGAKENMVHVLGVEDEQQSNLDTDRYQREERKKEEVEVARAASCAISRRLPDLPSRHLQNERPQNESGAKGVGVAKRVSTDDQDGPRKD